VASANQGSAGWLHGAEGGGIEPAAHDSEVLYEVVELALEFGGLNSPKRMEDDSYRDQKQEDRECREPCVPAKHQEQAPACPGVIENVLVRLGIRPLPAST
jgi:hypothetical protein